MNYSENELIPNVRKFVKKLQITIHSIGAIKIEKSPKNNLVRHLTLGWKEIRFSVSTTKSKERKSSEEFCVMKICTVKILFNGLIALCKI